VYKMLYYMFVLIFLIIYILAWDVCNLLNLILFFIDWVF